MSQGQEGATPLRTSGARAVRGAASRATTADHRSIASPVCPSGRHREHPRAGYAPVWSPARALHWTRQDALAASGACRGPQLWAAWGVVGRDAAGEDTLLPLCCPEGSVSAQESTLCL